jgi:zinc transport system substrate-binding protein
LKYIAGDKANITVMVKPGSSPHTYEPKPSQMKDITKADIYFSIDVEFEKSWLPKFKNQNINMIIVNMAKNITKSSISKHAHKKAKTESLDPHIWTSTSKVKQIAKNILISLIEVDQKNKLFYTNNYNTFIQHIENTNSKIKNILKNTKDNSSFMVFHPAWQYFANEFNLKQLAIEIDGKSPKPRELINILKEAKEAKIKAIFTAPEFSTKTANILAKQLNIKVIVVSPLNPQWSKNLINLANAIANTNENAR